MDCIHLRIYPIGYCGNQIEWRGWAGLHASTVRNIQERPVDHGVGAVVQLARPAPPRPASADRLSTQPPRAVSEYRDSVRRAGPIRLPRSSLLMPGGVGELAEGRVGARAVDRGGAAVHQDADPDRLGRLLFGGPGAGRSPGM